MPADPAEPPMDETWPDDMRRVGFACHPDDPVKVLATWDRPVCCMICGATAS